MKHSHDPCFMYLHNDTHPSLSHHFSCPSVNHHPQIKSYYYFSSQPRMQQYLNLNKRKNASLLYILIKFYTKKAHIQPSQSYLKNLLHTFIHSFPLCLFSLLFIPHTALLKPNSRELLGKQLYFLL